MILITGASGVLGRALVEELEREREEVFILSRDAVDLRNKEKTTELLKEISPRIVYHLAARVHGIMGNQRFPADMYTDNIRINTNVIDAAREAGVKKVVAAGTVAVYASARGPISEETIWNGPPESTEAAYGHSKRSMLVQLEAYERQYGLQFAFPILTNIYGPHDRFDRENGHVVPALIAKFRDAAKSGGPVSIWGTGAAQRDFIYSADAARALVLVAKEHNGAINVATGNTTTIRELVEAISRHSGVKEVVWDSSKPEGQIRREYDVHKLRALGFRPSVSLASGIAETYNWYDRNFPQIRR